MKENHCSKWKRKEDNNKQTKHTTVSPYLWKSSSSHVTVSTSLGEIVQNKSYHIYLQEYSDDIPMPSKTKTSISPCWRHLSLLLAVLVVAQFFLFVSVLESRHQPSHAPNNADLVVSVQAAAKAETLTVEKQQDSDKTSQAPEGVAATVMLRAPKWFHRRYTAMLHNALDNIPDTWSVQVFSNEEWLNKDVLPLHPGLQRLRTHPRIIWTPMPKDLTHKRPKEVMKNKWLWESVATEHVLFFTGNGVFCTNSKSRLEDFLEHDYVGVPWHKFGGVGGDATSHSLRKRSDMLRILDKYPPEPEMESVDSYYFAKHLVDEGTAKIADVNTTILFGGITEDLDAAPFCVSGTLPELEFKRREALLHVCPELNIIFPSLHEPGCFGAHPEPEKCKASICALQVPTRSC